MPFGPEDVFFAQCPPNNKTIVENKAYNLPRCHQVNDPRTCSVHIKHNRLWKGDFFKMKDAYCTEGVPSGSAIKNPPTVQDIQETQVLSLGQEDSLGEEMATHSNILARKILWTEEPGEL